VVVGLTVLLALAGVAGRAHPGAVARWEPAPPVVAGGVAGAGLAVVALLAAVVLILVVAALWPEEWPAPPDPSLKDLVARVLRFLAALLVAVLIGLALTGDAPETLPREVPEEGLPPPAPTAAPVSPADAGRLLTLGASAALAALAVAGVGRVRRARRTPTGVRAAPEPPSPAAGPDRAVRPTATTRAESVIAAYAELEALLGEAGLERGRPETPGEYAGRVADRLPAAAAPARRLTALYEVARFGERDVPPGSPEEAASSVAAVGDLLAERA